MRKICTKCQLEKDSLEFYKCRSNKDGLRGSCKLCMDSYCKTNKSLEKHRQYNKKYRAENRDEIVEKQREFRKNNPEVCYGYSKKWISNNKEKRNAIDRNWRKNNPERVAAMDKRNRTNNRGTKNSVVAKRRATKKNATIDYERFRDEIRTIYQNCPAGCEVDHIVPLVSDIVCGLHVPWNLQYLEKSENRRKGNRLICQTPQKNQSQQ